MKTNTQLRDAYLAVVDYCFVMYGDIDSVCDEMEFELYIHLDNKPSTLQRIIFNAVAFTADILLSL